MADPPRYSETDEDAGTGPDRGAASSPPRWVFVLGMIIAIALVVLIVLLHLTGTLGPGVH
jgi:hypothetical protein